MQHLPETMWGATLVELLTVVAKRSRVTLRRPKNGWGRTEVVCIVAVVGLLLQLLFPALNAAREASRRRVCAGNFRQVSQALLAYQAAHGSLPPAAIWTGESVGDITDLINREGQIMLLRRERPPEMVRKAWTQHVLPFLGRQELSDAFDNTVPTVATANQHARSASLTIMSCPSDDWNRHDNVYEISTTFGLAQFARGNIAINGGSHYIFESPGWLTNPRPNGVEFHSDLAGQTFELWGNGVAGINRSFSIDQFANGHSTTVLLDELRSGIDRVDSRGVWALGDIGASISWGHGISGDAYGPNNQIKDADDIRGCIEMYARLGKQFITEHGMPCCDHCRDNNQAGARSMHANGVFVAFADGSARFISDGIDVSVWHVMHATDTPRDILAESFERRLSGNTVKASSQDLRPSRSAALPSSLSADSMTLSTAGIEFAMIPAGEFMMGVPNAENQAPYPKEALSHRVRITLPFYLGKCEVTRGQFLAVMGYLPDGNDDTVDSQLPVTSVSWHEADEFCRTLSARGTETNLRWTYRLPTEAEWEYAARGGSDIPFGFDSEWTNVDETGAIGCKAWKPDIRIQPVGSYKPNPFGLHDMCGNVFEWTNDWFDLKYYQNSPVDDPQGPSSGYLRVVRGWYWLFTGPACVVNISPPPWKSSPFIGFRIVAVPSSVRGDRSEEDGL